MKKELDQLLKDVLVRKALVNHTLTQLQKITGKHQKEINALLDELSGLIEREQKIRELIKKTK